VTSLGGAFIFTYNISLGTWDVSKLGVRDQEIITTLFIMATLILCVTMLNLLIAVVSATYERVRDTS
jgi:hypothetical protein